MLFSEYLHEKAEESRHNETVGYFIATIGSVFFMGGHIITLTKGENPSWFLIIPYNLALQPYNLLALSATVLGFVLLCLGIAISIYYARERTWYMKELHKAHSTEEKELVRKGRENIVGNRK
jgi:hypothetical protein